jgi:hypothetical protein
VRSLRRSETVPGWHRPCCYRCCPKVPSQRMLARADLTNDSNGTGMMMIPKSAGGMAMRWIYPLHFLSPRRCERLFGALVTTTTSRPGPLCCNVFLCWRGRPSAAVPPLSGICRPSSPTALLPRNFLSKNHRRQQHPLPPPEETGARAEQHDPLLSPRYFRKSRQSVRRPCLVVVAAAGTQASCFDATAARLFPVPTQ